MTEERIYRCRTCGKVLFHTVGGAVEVKKGKQRLTFSDTGAVEAHCDRCEKDSRFDLKTEGRYAEG